MPKLGLHNPLRPTKARSTRRVWQIRFYDNHGIRQCDTIGTCPEMSRREAELILRKRQGRMDGGDIPIDRPEKTTIEQFTKHYIYSRGADIRLTTIEKYRNAAKHLADALGGKTLLHSITVADANKVKLHLKKKGIIKSTISTIMVQISAMLKQAVKEKYLHSNPFMGMSGSSKKIAKPMRHLKAHEVDAMIRACGEVSYNVSPAHTGTAQHWRMFIKLGLTTGLRRGEMRHLLWKNIDFEQATIYVQGRRNSTFEVNGQKYHIFEWPTKTEQNRAVPIPKETLEMLREFQLTSGGSAYVFLGLRAIRHYESKANTYGIGVEAAISKGVNYYAYDKIQHAARELLAKDAGVTLSKIDWQMATVHDLRKNYCHMLKRQGIPVDVYAKLIGDTVKVALEHYTTTSDEDLDDARRAIDAALSKTDALRTRSTNISTVKGDNIGVIAS